MPTDGVLLLHGLGRTAGSMRTMERALARAGYATFNCNYPSRRHDLAALADHVAERTAAWRADLDGRLHLVTHSMGGLIARVLVARHAGFGPPRLGRAIMLGPPNGGSEIATRLGSLAAYRRIFGPAGAQLGTAGWGEALADCLDWPVACPVLVIAGRRSLDPLGWLLLPRPNDGKVSVAATRLPGAEHLVLPATHSLMVRDPAAIRATLAFLQANSSPTAILSPRRS